MQTNVAAGQHHDHQPALPTYAEAIRTAPPATNSPYPPSVNADETYHAASAPFYQTPSQPIPSPYAAHNQTNYNQAMFTPVAVGTYPPTYVNNPYPQYGPTSDEHGPAPTTIHIIRPVPIEPAGCCSGRGGRILAIVLSIVILTAILRVTMNSYF